MEAPMKLLIVGDKGTGKSSIIQCFREFDPFMGTNNNSRSTANVTNEYAQMSFTGQSPSKLNSLSPPYDKVLGQTNKNISNKVFASKVVQQDFSLKILRIDGKKVRVHLWDQGPNMNAQTTFQPMYIRHAAGCIIVANTSNQKTLERAYRWKEYFEKKTKIPNEPCVPATLFINHDNVERSKAILEQRKQFPVKLNQRSNTNDEGKDSDSQKSFYLALDDEDINQAKSLEQFGSMFPSKIDNDLVYDQQLQKQQNSQQNSYMKENPESHAYFERFRTLVDYENKNLLEKLAQVDSKAFFGVYHVSLGQPETVYQAFENFLSRVIEEQKNTFRTETNDSKLFEDTMRSFTLICKCKELQQTAPQNSSMTNKESSLVRESEDEQQMIFTASKSEQESKGEMSHIKHHPQCPMSKFKNKNGMYASSGEDSIVLRRLAARRFDGGKHKFYELPPNQQRNSCC